MFTGTCTSGNVLDIDWAEVSESVQSGVPCEEDIEGAVRWLNGADRAAQGMQLVEGEKCFKL